MKTALVLLESYGKLTTLLLCLTYLLHLYLKHRLFFDHILKPNCDKILNDLYQDLKYAKKSGAKKSIRRFIKSKIRLWEFVKLTGYKWNKMRRDCFIKVYDMTEGSLTLKSVKFLFANSKIEEGVFEVETSKMTKFDFICRVVFSLIMFTLLPLLGFLFYLASGDFTQMMLIYLLFGSSLIIGIHNVVTVVQERSFLRNMKIKYNNTYIG